jgi:hypothetical protein
VELTKNHSFGPNKAGKKIIELLSLETGRTFLSFQFQ